jgi:hypothetical protein
VNPSKRREVSTFGCAVLLAAALLRCEPELVVGTLDLTENCDPGATPDGMLNDTGILPDPVATPWETSFEDGVCSFAETQGYCYSDEASEYRLVGSPVRSGTVALAFEIAPSVPQDGNLQARCVQQGALPNAASYRASFFLPSTVDSADNWNLFHFDGRSPSDPHGLWDVSITRETSGALRLFVWDFLRGMMRPMPDLPDLPIGSWFEVEVVWERSTDRDGRFEVYLDGESGLELNGLITDDTELGQWYVGNLATSLSPLPYTLYVDDIAISDR